MNLKTVPFDFEIQTIYGVLPSYHIEVPDIALGLKDVVPFVQQVALDIVCQAAAVSSQKGEPVRCCTGCTKCCYYPLPVSVPEAIYLVEYLLSLPVSKRHTILERFEKNELKCSEYSLIEPLRESQRGIDVYRTGKAYFDLNLACPFLNEDRCGIHTDRPITCREHNVVSSPDLCRNPFAGETVPLGLQRHYSERLQAFANHLCNTGKGNVVMPLLFEWYDNNREIAQMRWHGPELFSAVIEYTVGNPPE
jgi:Fe-S-cluster containining protein